MLSRLSGLVVIINTVLPLLVAAGCFSVFAAARAPTRDLFAAVDSIHAEVVLLDSTLIDAAVDTIGARVELAKQRVATAGEVIAAVNRSVRAGFRRLNLRVNFPGLPTIELPFGLEPIRLPQLPDIDFRIGDELVKPFRAIGSALGYLFDISDDFQRMVAAVRDVVESQQIAHLKTHVEEVQEAWRRLKRVAGFVTTTIKILLFLVVPWVGLSYGLWAHGRLARGWALLQGRTP